MNTYEKTRKASLEMLESIEFLEGDDDFFVVAIAALEMVKNTILNLPGQDSDEEEGE